MHVPNSLSLRSMRGPGRAGDGSAVPNRPRKWYNGAGHPLGVCDYERNWCGMSFGQRLRGLRRDLDLSQAEIADKGGCSVNTIRKLESDERKPSRELATRLAEVFELSPRDRTEFLRLARGTQSVGRPSLPSPMTRL